MSGGGYGQTANSNQFAVGYGGSNNPYSRGAPMGGYAPTGYQPSSQNPFARTPYNTDPNTNQPMPSMGMSQPYGNYGMNAMARPDAGQFQQRMMFNYLPQSQSKMGYAGRYTMDSTRPPIDKPPPPPGSQTPPPGYQPTPSPTPPPVVPTPTPSPTPPPTYAPDPNPTQTAVGPWNVTQGPYGGGANGLLAYNTALMFDPRAAASKPTDSAMGWNQLTGSWEAFK